MICGYPDANTGQRYVDCMLQVCRSKGAASCETYAVDLFKSGDAESFAKAVLSKQKDIDVLVTIAGMSTACQNTSC